MLIHVQRIVILLMKVVLLCYKLNHYDQDVVCGTI